MSMCLIVQFSSQLIQTFTAQSLMNALTLSGFFYLWGGVQVVVIVVFTFILKESKGLDLEDKLSLYSPLAKSISGSQAWSSQRRISLLKSFSSDSKSLDTTMT